MEYRLCDHPWGTEEIEAIQRVVDTGMFTMGKNVSDYEKEFAKKMGARYAVMVNSGSSANLLAVAALVYSGRLPRGSEVIVPAVSWSTTYAPLEQFGMKLVFADIDAETLNIDMQSLESCITDQTKMIFLANLLGNPNDFARILPLCAQKDILLLEDNCESLGAEYAGKKAGTFGLIGTFSTFYSHHLCTMEGGVAVTSDTQLYEYMLSIRAHGWTRDLPADSRLYQKKGSFYESFYFLVPGYNLRPLEMEGAIGLEQLKKMDRMIHQRRKNAAYFQQNMKAFQTNIRIQKEVGNSSWFGFSMVFQGGLAGQRDCIVQMLAEYGIEARPIVAGNFTRNQVIKYMDYRIPFPLTHADEIHDNGIFIGNHSSANYKEVDYLIQVLQKIEQERK